jgi:hypothetical protein
MRRSEEKNVSYRQEGTASIIVLFFCVHIFFELSSSSSSSSSSSWDLGKDVSTPSKEESELWFVGKV